MGPLVEALRDFLRLLEDLRLEHVLMGGFAVRIYGVPRPTYDIDFTVAIARERLPELYRALEEAGYTVPEQYAGGWVDQVSGMPLVKFRLFLEDEGIDIDVFLAESDYQREVLRRRRRGDVDGVTVWIVTPEDLILLKLMANRPRDLVDVADICFMLGDLDEAYMRRWAAELGITDRLKHALSEPLL